MLSFIYLLLLLIAALFFGKVADKLGQPTIVGNIFGGLVFGPLFLMLLKAFHIAELDVVVGDLQPSAVEGDLSLLMDFAIVMLMFSSGLETRIKDFIASFRTGIFTASLGVALPFTLGFVGTYLYLGDVMIALYIGGALSITAVALSISTLIQMDAIQTRFGMTIINAAIVDDIIGIVILSVLLSMSASHHLPSAPSIATSLGLAVLFVIVVLFLTPKVLKILYASTRDLRPSESVGFTILIAGLFGVIAHLMGLHLMIGAFLGGMAVRESLNTRTRAALEKWSFGFFAPVFFAWVGFSVTFTGAALSLFVPLLIGLGLVGKVVGSGLGAKISGLSWAESLLVGVGMNGRAAVDLILASVALGAGIIGRDIYSAIVLNAVIMAMLTPIALKKLSTTFFERGWIQRNGAY